MTESDAGSVSSGREPAPIVPAPVDQPRPGPVSADPVDAEWEKLERERVEEEIDEAREDLAESLTGPREPSIRSAWMWVAFGIALLAGGAFAAWVNLHLITPRPAQTPEPIRQGSNAPSPSELGPGIGRGSESPADAADPTDGGAAP